MITINISNDLPKCFVLYILIFFQYLKKNALCKYVLFQKLDKFLPNIITAPNERFFS